jgi:hypothetical protein
VVRKYSNPLRPNSEAPTLSGSLVSQATFSFHSSIGYLVPFPLSPLFAPFRYAALLSLFCYGGNQPFRSQNTPDAYDTARMALFDLWTKNMVFGTDPVHTAARLVTTVTLDKRQLSAAIPDGISYTVRTISWCFDHPFADSKQLRSIPLK